LWLFLFNTSGAVNKFLSYLSISGPNWFNDPRGILGLLWGAFGLSETGPLAQPGLFGISAWQWLQGPSVAMFAFILMAIFTTSGTFMLLFIAALQSIGEETEEAAMIDGASVWQRFRYVTVPMLKPTIYTVVTLGLIGTWQVFDQIAIGSKGDPSKTTLTPAYLSYQKAFIDLQWGQGAAIAFVLFGIIVVMTILQRLILGNADPSALSRRDRRAGARRAAQAAVLRANTQAGAPVASETDGRNGP